MCQEPEPSVGRLPLCFWHRTFGGGKEAALALPSQLPPFRGAWRPQAGKGLKVTQEGGMAPSLPFGTRSRLPRHTQRGKKGACGPRARDPGGEGALDGMLLLESSSSSHTSLHCCSERPASPLRPLFVPTPPLPLNQRSKDCTGWVRVRVSGNITATRGQQKLLSRGSGKQPRLPALPRGGRGEPVRRRPCCTQAHGGCPDQGKLRALEPTR